MRIQMSVLAMVVLIMGLFAGSVYGQAKKGLPVYKCTNISSGIDPLAVSQNQSICIAYSYYTNDFNKASSTGNVYINISNTELMGEAISFVKTYFAQMGATAWTPSTGTFNKQRKKVGADDIKFANGDSLSAVVEKWVQSHAKVKSKEIKEKDKGATKYGTIKSN